MNPMDDLRPRLGPPRGDGIHVGGIEITAQQGESSLVLGAECPRSLHRVGQNWKYKNWVVRSQYSTATANSAPIPAALNHVGRHARNCQRNGSGLVSAGDQPFNI